MGAVVVAVVVAFVPGFDTLAATDGLVGLVAIVAVAVAVAVAEAEAEAEGGGLTGLTAAVEGIERTCSRSA